MKKLLSFLLSVIMISCIFTIVPFTVSAAEYDYPEIRVGETVTVTIENEGDVAYLKFTPEEDVSIVFTSLSNSDTYGYLYDEDMVVELISDDDSGSGGNFKITYSVVAGETYYLGAKFWGGSTGSLSIRLIVPPEWEHDGDTLTKYNGNATEITIPSEIDGEAITKIGDSAFSNCSSLTSVIIPDSVTSIGYGAFNGCSSLTSVTIPDTVTSIGKYAFDNCISLTSVTIPNSVTSIEYQTFYKCSSLTSVMIGDSVTSIGDEAFRGCGSLASVTIGDSVTSIGKYAFDNCISLTSVIIPDSVTSIGYYAFNGCSSLTSVTIPDTVTSMRDHAFSYCSSLTSVTIGDSVTSIGSAFYGCRSLTSVTIGNSVSSIESGAFSGCTSLESITVSSGNTVYDSRDNCNAIIETATNTLILGCKNTDIPNSVTSIGSAFNDCRSLTSVIIPDSVTSIGNWAFDGCSSLASVIIPDSVTSIGYGAFERCSSLASVTIPDSVTSIGNRAIGYSSFGDKVDDFTIYGYADTAAETYANENDFIFVALSDEADEATGVTASVTDEAALKVEDVTDTDETTKIEIVSKKILKAYDITLTKDGETVQPEHNVTVKIPCEEENAKVYRVEADNSLTDMNAAYKDGYLVFTTEHFSLYLIAAEGAAQEYILGDANDDKDVDIVDATFILRYELGYSIFGNTDESVILRNGDVNGDGGVDIIDATAIQRYLLGYTGKGKAQYIGRYLPVE